MKKQRMFVWLALLMILLVPRARAGAEIVSPSQLNDPSRVIGVSTGAVTERMIRVEMPLARVVHYNDIILGYKDVASGKIDAFIYDLRQMELAIQEGMTGVHLLEETMKETVKIAVGLSPVSKIPDLKGKINRFIAELREDGILDDMFDRWVARGDQDMPEIDAPASPQGCLVVATTGNVPPYSYYLGTDLNGYDIELARRFAAWLGMDLRFEVMDFDAVVPAAAGGKVDCIMSNLQVMPERAENFLFSDVLYEERHGIMVRGDAPGGGAGQADGSGEQGAPGGITGLDRMHGARVGVGTGTSFDAMVRKALPDAQVVYINTTGDLIAALEAGKIDGMVVDEPAARQICAENSRLAILPEYLDSFDFGFALPRTERGEELLRELNAWLVSMREAGELDRIMEKWASTDEDGKTLPDYAAFPAEKGTLTLATEGDYVPLNYFRGKEIVGAEIDLAAQFCQANHYGLRITKLTFDSILPAIQTGKADFAAAGITITPERAESVNFSEPYYSGGTVMLVLKERTAAGAEAGGDAAGSLWDGIVSSFRKTFIRENRWQLFLDGIGNTLLITLLSILFGTAVGFLAFMACRNGHPAALRITRFCTWLVQGMPMVVMLMILYYIIFGSVAISGIAVAVIGFTLTFGSSVFGLLRMGVSAVDRGQYEAACALGYSNRRAFFRIILPQAVPHMLPAYQGEIVGLIKATAIVGYIAIQDLTKMGDIVRSRTYEAFFPLIAVTVIYFLLEGLLGFAVSRVRISIDPRRRRPEQILKGIVPQAEPAGTRSSWPAAPRKGS